MANNKTSFYTHTNQASKVCLCLEIISRLQVTAHRFRLTNTYWDVSQSSAYMIALTIIYFLNNHIIESYNLLNKFYRCTVFKIINNNKYHEMFSYCKALSWVEMSTVSIPLSLGCYYKI